MLILYTDMKRFCVPGRVIVITFVFCFILFVICYFFFFSDSYLHINTACLNAQIQPKTFTSESVVNDPCMKDNVVVFWHTQFSVCDP